MVKIGRPRKTERNKVIVELYDKKGLSFGKIAEMFGIRKQSVHEIYHREKSQGNYPQKKV